MSSFGIDPGRKFLKVSQFPEIKLLICFSVYITGYTETNFLEFKLAAFLHFLKNFTKKVILGNQAVQILGKQFFILDEQRNHGRQPLINKVSNTPIGWKI